MDLRKCLTDTSTPSSCFLLRDDYLECLHHRKEARGTASAHRHTARTQTLGAPRARACTSPSHGPCPQFERMNSITRENSACQRRAGALRAKLRRPHPLANAERANQEAIDHAKAVLDHKYFGGPAPSAPGHKSH